AARIHGPATVEPRPETRATGAIGAHTRFALMDSVIEADVAADRSPDAVVMQFVAQYARFMGGGKRIGLAEAEIAQAAPLGNEHQGETGGHGKSDIAHRLAEAGAGDILRADKEIGQQKLPADAPDVEGAVRGDADRPHGIALVVVAGGEPTFRIESG